GERGHRQKNDRTEPADHCRYFDRGGFKKLDRTPQPQRAGDSPQRTLPLLAGLLRSSPRESSSSDPAEDQTRGEDDHADEPDRYDLFEVRADEGEEAERRRGSRVSKCECVRSGGDSIHINSG